MEASEFNSDIYHAGNVLVQSPGTKGEKVKGRYINIVRN